MNTAKFHIVDINALIDEFKNGQITENLQYKYLLAEFVAISFVVSISIQTAPMGDIEWTITTLIALLGTVIGTMKAYQVNALGDNTNFVARYIALSFVLSVRLTAITIFASIGLGLLAGITQSATLLYLIEEGSILGIVVTGVLLLIFYYLLIRYIREISSQNT